MTVVDVEFGSEEKQVVACRKQGMAREMLLSIKFGGGEWVDAGLVISTYPSLKKVTNHHPSRSTECR
jgi:hypothetical protein